LVQSIFIGRRRWRLPAAGPTAADEASPRISFWWSLTASALALARYLEGRGSLSGQRAIELGCGLGLAGATAASLGAEATFTDASPAAVESARELCELNGIEADVAFETLDWQRAPAHPGRFDLVLGSEVLYDYGSHCDLLQLIRALAAPEGYVILADRKRLVVSRFLGRMIDAGFACDEALVRADLPGTEPQPVSVFVLRRLGAG
jgi:predicted nicotinamide N-methyase